MIRWPKWFLAAAATSLFLGLVASVWAARNSGTVTGADDKEKVVYATCDDGNWAVYAAKKCTITRNNSKASIGDLQKGDRVTFYYSGGVTPQNSGGAQIKACRASRIVAKGKN
jgi:hypothetical protein